MNKNTFIKFLTSTLLSVCVFFLFHHFITLSPLILTLVQIISPPLEHLVIDYLFETVIMLKKE